MLLVLLVLVLLLVLAFVALVFVFVFIVFFVVLVLSAALLLLLLLCLLQQFFCVGEVVARVVVFGSEFQGFLIVVYGLLELLQTLGPVFFLETGFQVAVAAVVQYLAALLGVEVGLLHGAVVVLDGFVVFLLPVEGIAQIILSAVGSAVVVQGAAVVDFSAVVALCLVFSVALSGFFAHGAVLGHRGREQHEK